MVGKVLIVTGLLWEAREVVRHLEEARATKQGGVTSWEGTHHGVHVVVLPTGMGPQRAARALRTQRALRPDAVLSTGCAGGLVSGLVAGDAIVAEQITLREGAPRPTAIEWRARYQAAAAAAGLRSRCGSMLSLPAIAAGEEKRRLAGSGALAVEMEAAAVADWAVEMGAPFAAARVILDTLELPIPIDVVALTEADGGVAPRRAIAAVARRPSILKDFVAIGQAARRCRSALSALHRELFRAL